MHQVVLALAPQFLMSGDKYSPIPFNMPEPDGAARLLQDMQDWMFFCSDRDVVMEPLPSSPPTTVKQEPQSGTMIYCHVTSCYKMAQANGYCTAHGFGKVCKEPHCSNAAQSHGFCKGHGGGARCKFEQCTKSSQGGGFCRAHGGGKRCSVEGCTKGVQRNNKCATHGGCRRCTVPECTKSDRGGGLCDAHRKERQCKIYGCKRLGHDLGLCKPHGRRYLHDCVAQLDINREEPSDVNL
ncbi:hypothetical protein Ae201684P_007358 [Aphanomyces euteiches]|uniref:WRKY19-like zinc finger domain-containing protein n=1 Tax=Aphanomyces euteiches TaxID=100861 RepID=A0A6G0X8G9_9STRA|nr:hypothetical protein Ae201684_007361 [Aphanomyces euteiches]KAH9101173.1 hypothetical protein Ae201684P_007358 [Aphanomyces euteiches]KAH9154796.1 hypothetical protein AeRB84_003164 [Aphanomyces euteiches]